MHTTVDFTMCLRPNAFRVARIDIVHCLKGRLPMWATNDIRLPLVIITFGRAIDWLREASFRILKGWFMLSAAFDQVPTIFVSGGATLPKRKDMTKSSTSS